MPDTGPKGYLGSVGTATLRDWAEELLEERGGQVAAPVISYDSSTGLVSITSATTDAEIRYTLDGSEPTKGSTLYSAPFAVSGTVVVKAKGYKENVVASKTVEQTIVTTRVWGVKWPRSTSSSPQLVRLTPETDPYGLVTETVTTEPVPAYSATAQGSSPFDVDTPWAEMRMRNITGTTLGAWEDESGFSLSTANVMVYLPEIYYAVKKDSNGDWYYYVADGNGEGLLKHPGGGKYLARYFQDSSYQSKTGGSAQTVTLTSHRTQATSKGAGFYLGDAAARALADLLYIIEYADWNSQQIIGNGNTPAQSVNGGTDAMVYHTGTTGSTCQYRHLENLWGYYEWVDGILFQNGQAYICTDHTKYASTLTGDYVEYGTQQTNPPQDTYITDFMQDDDYAWLMFVPCAGGGSSTTYVPDYGYISTSSPLYGLCVGSYGGSGSYFGLFYFSVYYSPGGISYAARLAYSPSN